MKKKTITLLVLQTAMTRVLYENQYDAKGYTDQNSLANALLTRPDKLNPILTFYMGKDSDMFPLTFMSEGQTGGVKEVEDVQYEWDIMGRMKHTDRVVSSTYTTGDKPGLNGTPVYVLFETAWLIEQHGVVTPNGTMLRVMTKPERVGQYFKYTFQLKEADATAYVALTEFAAGLKWSMIGGATVPESLSMGNRSNIQTPGKRTNQISFLRKSYTIAGNIANRQVTEIDLPVEGRTTKLWMDFEEWQNHIEFKKMCEEHYWYSTYNRRTDGSVPMKDYDTGLPITEGAGIFQIVRQANFDTYGLDLTVQKLKTTVGDVMYGATDTGKMMVTLYGGLGFLEDFDAAIKLDGTNRGFAYALSFEEIQSTGEFMTYGKYFNAYKTVSGHTIVTKHLPLLDFGARSENSPKHPRTGYPLSSHTGIFIDQSTYDGVKNVQMINQKGRALLRGIEKGMSPIPASWGGNASPYVSTGQDKATLHLFKSSGININRDNHCFLLECTLS